MCGSRKFRQGGGGPGQSDKKSSDNVQRNLSFFKVSEGVQHFPGGGGPAFSSCLFPIETHITSDFPGGGGVRTPCPPPSGSALGGFNLIR